MENKKNYEKRAELMDKYAEEHKKDFEGLSKEQQILVAFRKIIEIKNESKSLQIEKESNELKLEEMDKILAIINASDYNTGLIKPLILSIQGEDNDDIKKIYKKSLISYNNVLKNYKKLAEELGIDKSLELSHLFTYMLWNGYFSVTKKHSYKLEDRLLLPSMNSFDVIKGNGVCLAYAEFLHNYLTVCDKKSAPLNCKVPTRKKEITCNYRPEIERDVQSSNLSVIKSKIAMLLLNGLIKKTGNHAVTLIEEDNKFFVYDPTNLYVLNVVDGNTATLINGKGNFELKPISTFMIDPNSDPNHLFEKIYAGNIEAAFTRKELILSFENIMELIKNNTSLLDDAYDNIHNELELINKQTDEIGGVLKVLKKLK